MSEMSKQVISTVNHPSHYNQCNPLYETIEVIEAWNLGFNIGNAVKYIARAPHKGKIIEDYEKAIWYIQREVERLSKREKNIISPLEKLQPNKVGNIDTSLEDTKSTNNNSERIGW